MADQRHVILGVHITDRVKHAGQVQQLFTEYGCSIKTRLGLHDANENQCSPNGLILLEMAGGESNAMELAGKLNRVEGVEVQQMIFDHP
ncbi:MAG TPA: hypothetical protein DCZ95_07195 [Verrucomicrobia bacterium]|nr:MAG: hypothetical protein A2X46_05475 [Lentisphaerae bacterium GWF2_57_35]HBA83860.1 hypothetical protein [Verrucomicrobiota bacterium]